MRSRREFISPYLLTHHHLVTNNWHTNSSISKRRASILNGFFPDNNVETPLNIDYKDSLNPLSAISVPSDLIKLIDMCIPPNLKIASSNCSGFIYICIPPHLRLTSQNCSAELHSLRSYSTVNQR